MINFTVDDIVPCLKDTTTGDLYDTEVIRIRRRSILSKYNQHTGWYVNWGKFPADIEVYALVLKGTNDIQGIWCHRITCHQQSIPLHDIRPCNRKTPGGIFL